MYFQGIIWEIKKGFGVARLVLCQNCFPPVASKSHHIELPRDQKKTPNVAKQQHSSWYGNGALAVKQLCSECDVARLR